MPDCYKEDPVIQLVISREASRCKLVVAERPVEQVMAFSHLGVEKDAKTKVYKTCIRPIMCAVKTRADNRRMKSILTTAEMRVLRRIGIYAFVIQH